MGALQHPHHTHPIQQLDRGNVEAVGQAGPGRHRAVHPAVVVERGVALVHTHCIGDGGVPDDSGRADEIVAERGGVEDRFDGTAGLTQTGRHIDLTVDLLIEKVQAAYHRQNVICAGAQGHQCRIVVVEASL